MAEASAGDNSDDSRCLLLALNHDELGVIVDGLADPLHPVVAVALISTCKGLRTPSFQALYMLMQRHWRAAALARKASTTRPWNGRMVLPDHFRRPGWYDADSRTWVEMTCARLRGQEQLDLADIDLTADDMTTLGMILRKWLPNTPLLDLTGCHCEDAGMQAMCNGLGRGDALSLRALQLEVNDFGPAGTEALAAALLRGAMRNLETLDLSGNPIGSQGAAALAPALRKLPVLRTLVLSYCDIGDEGVTALVDGLGTDDFKALEHLSLRSEVVHGHHDHTHDHSFSDAGVDKLSAALVAGGMPTIQRSYLQGSFVKLDQIMRELVGDTGANTASPAAVRAMRADLITIIKRSL